VKSGFVILIWTATALACASARAQDTPPAPDSKQEVNRYTAPVDAAVHADINERAKQLPRLLPQQPKKLPTATTFSRWGFQSPKQSPAIRFSPANATKPSGAGSSPESKNTSALQSPIFQPNLQPPASAVWDVRLVDSSNAVPNDANSQKLNGQPVRLGSSLREHTLRGSTVSQSFQTLIPPLSSPQWPQSGGFSSRFHEKHLGVPGPENSGSALSSLPNPFPRRSPPPGQARSKTDTQKHHPKEPKPSITQAIQKDSQDMVKP
jgi:hypothetical protein